MYKNFRLIQWATNLPLEVAQGDVQGVVLWEQDSILFISLKDFWIRVDLDGKSYAVGDYEG